MTTTSPTRRRLPLWLRVPLAPAVWLERAKGWRRLALLALYLVVASVSGIFAGRALILRGLPDIGDPFDVKEFLAAETIPEGRNAFPLYRKAQELLRAATSEAIRKGERAADDREAMDLFLKATAMPDARARVPGFAAEFADLITVHDLITKSVEKADALRALGDTAGAWTWLRAALRATRHVGLHGRVGDRWSEVHMRNSGSPLTKSARAWAADPRADVAQIREALGEAIQDGTRIPPTARGISVEYLHMMRFLDDPDFLRQARAEDEKALAKGPIRWYEGNAAYRELRWFLRNEPERSRRIVRQGFAQWLGRRGAAVLSPEELARQSEASAVFRGRYVGPDPRGDVLDADRKQQADWVVFLAERLYRRRHGKMPATADDLLGADLREFPPGFDPSAYPPKSRAPATPGPGRRSEPAR